MDFRRIDEDTVQCILSEEEMNSYGLRTEDLFSDQEKVRGFLEHLVEMASEEIGYEAKSGMVSMQIMKMPNNDLVITLSERDPGEAFQQMIQHLHQQLAGLLDPEMMERLTDLQDMDEEELPFNESAATLEAESESRQKYQEHLREVEQKKQEKIRCQQIAPKLFRFDNLRGLSQFVCSVTLEKPINSAVFSDSQDGSYYLLLKKGRLKREEYVQLCESIPEFGTLYSSQPYVEEYCREHFKVFIPKQAIRILKQIETGNKSA